MTIRKANAAITARVLFFTIFSPSTRYVVAGSRRPWPSEPDADAELHLPRELRRRRHHERRRRAVAGRRDQVAAVEHVEDVVEEVERAAAADRQVVAHR